MTASDKMLTVRIPPDLRDAIDAVRGDVPRERWVRNALMAVVSDSPRTNPQTTGRIVMGPEHRPPPPEERARIDRLARLNAPALARLTGQCPDCGKANGVHKGDCPAHPRGKR